MWSASSSNLASWYLPDRDPREEPLLLRRLHLALQGAVRDRFVALEVDRPDLDLRTLLDVEDHLHQLRAPRERLHRRVDLGELVALLGHQVAHDALDPPHNAFVEERIEPERDSQLLHLLVDLGAFHLARPGVVDDLDPRPLFHVVDDPLADHPVRVGIVVHLNPQVVQEVGRPQPLEVVEQHLFRGVGVGRPDAVTRPAGLCLDVIQVGLRLDERLVDGVKPQLDRANDRRGTVRGCPDRRLRRGRRRLGRGRRGPGCGAGGVGGGAGAVGG